MEEVAGEATEVMEEEEEEVVVVEEDGEAEDGTKVDMEIMEDMVDMEGREDGTSFNFDSSDLLCLFPVNTIFFLHLFKILLFSLAPVSSFTF